MKMKKILFGAFLALQSGQAFARGFDLVDTSFGPSTETHYLEVGPVCLLKLVLQVHQANAEIRHLKVKYLKEPGGVVLIGPTGQVNSGYFTKGTATVLNVKGCIERIAVTGSSLRRSKDTLLSFKGIDDRRR